MPKSNFGRDPDLLSESEQRSLNWIDSQLGESRSRRLFVLVAGLGHQDSGVLSLDDFVRQQAGVALSARAIIEKHDGRIGAGACAATIGYWPCFGIEQWRAAMAAANQIAANADIGPVASVAVHAGQLCCQQAHSVAGAKEALIGPVVHETLRQQMSTAPRGIWCSQSFQRFALDRHQADAPHHGQSKQPLQSEGDTAQRYSGLASPDWTGRPQQETAHRDRVLDRLEGRAVVVQAASVLGCSFQLHELAGLLRMSQAALRPLLGVLCDESVLECTPALTSDTQYRFKDPKLCDVAYSYLTAPTLNKLHSRALAVLRDDVSSTDRSVRKCCAIADHGERSGDKVEAVRWLSIAGQVAIRTNRTTSAIAILELAAAKLRQASTPAMAREHKSISHLLTTQLAMTKGNAASNVRRAHHQLSDLSSRESKTETLDGFDALWVSLRCHLTVGNLRAARGIARQVLHIAERGTAKHQLLAHRLAGQTEFLRGNAAAACFHFSRVVALYDATQHAQLRFSYGSDQLALALAHRSWAHALRGARAAALHDSRSAFIQARKLNHPHTLAHALGILGLVHEILDERVTAKIYCMTSATLADQYRFAYWQAWSRIVKSALAIAEEPMAAINDLLHADREYRSTGAAQICGYVFGKVAEAHLRVEDIDRAEEFANLGIKHCHRTGILVDQPVLQLVLSQCLRQRNDQRRVAMHPGPVTGQFAPMRKDALIKQNQRVARDAAMYPRTSIRGGN